MDDRLVTMQVCSNITLTGAFALKQDGSSGIRRVRSGSSRWV